MSQDDDDPAPCSGPSICSSTNRTKRTKVYKGTTFTLTCLVVILNICEVVTGYHHSVQDVRVVGFSRTRDSAFVRFRYRCGIGSSDEKTRNGDFLLDVGLAKHKEGCQPIVRRKINNLKLLNVFRVEGSKFDSRPIERRRGKMFLGLMVG
jgi:hypothetical protein